MRECTVDHGRCANDVALVLGGVVGRVLVGVFSEQPPARPASLVQAIGERLILTGTDNTRCR